MKRLLLISLLFCCPQLMVAQQTLTAKEMVAITPMLSHNVDLPSDANSSLGVKLSQMVTQNGFGSNSGQFILTANVVVLDKHATGTVPPQYITKLEVSVYLLNVVEQVVIDEMSFEVQGVDRLENKTLIQAINSIKPKSVKVRAFMEEARIKIIEYYNTRIPAMLAKAQSLADRNEYEEALYVLSSVPESVDQYPMVADQMAVIYKKKIDREATAALQDAKAKIAIKDYEGAVDALSWVDPSSSLSPKVYELITAMKQKINAEEQAVLAEKMRLAELQAEKSQRLHDDNVALTKMQIESAGKVGVESAKTQTSMMESLNKWFLGKFR